MAPKKKNFEEQLAQLEDLVSQLESGELSLEDGVLRYGEGVKLLKDLFSSLSSAEQKVEELSDVLRSSLEEDDDDAGDE